MRASPAPRRSNRASAWTCPQLRHIEPIFENFMHVRRRPRSSIHDHRKAVRCIGASREPPVSLFRRCWRTKTGVSVKLAGRLLSTNEPCSFGGAQTGKSRQSSACSGRANVAYCHKLDEQASAGPLDKPRGTKTSGRRRLANDGTKSVRLGSHAEISCWRHRREPASPENGASTRRRRFRRLLWYRIRS